MSTLPTIGIDLGTTHTVMAVCTEPKSGSSRVLEIPQLVSEHTLEARALVPSCVYFAPPGEGKLALPWDPDRTYAVGEYARRRAIEAPGRVVSSSKSWLSHPGVDRRSPLLPTHPAEDIEPISPVEAAFRIIDHLVEAWPSSGVESANVPLAEHEVVIAVPASFDAAARDLTVEAAMAAGLDNISLLEEPQAAMYAWLEHMGDDFRQHLAPGDLVLVVDVGGGTTDFSAIVALEREGNLELQRVAVGDHILLGGDNMDLLLAHHLRGQLEAEGPPLDSWQFLALLPAARDAKESLLTRANLDSVPVSIAGRGAQLLGQVRRAALERQQVQKLVAEGFFPETSATESPKRRTRTGLTEVGLPYATDPAITRHLAAFLLRQADALGDLPGFSQDRGRLCPSRVLFNGGVFKSSLLRDRLLSTLGAWHKDAGIPEARVLPGEDLDHAVAKGAAYFAQLRRSDGLRIRGGTARAYYVGLESPAPAVPGFEPPLEALCVAPFGMQEGAPPSQLDDPLALVVGEPVSFRFFGTSVRRDDGLGKRIPEPERAGLEELSPIEVTLPAEGREQGHVVPVHLATSITAVGTLLLEAVPTEPLVPNERWKIELNVRGDRSRG